MTENTMWIGINILVVLAGAAILAGLLVEAVRFFIDFSQELQYINNEIHRTTGQERKRWEQRKRRLWLSLIPFVKY